MFTIKGTQPERKTEIIAGVTTFLTMAYIVVVNPATLAAAGVPINTAFMATIIAALVGTLLMAFFANYPIAIAPGMGMNAYFAYSVALPHKSAGYQVAFAAVFLAALLFVLLSLTPLRTRLIEAIPNNLKHSIAAGIGLFIAFIGLRLTGIVRAAPDTTLVTLGDLHNPAVLLALAGLVITLVLMVLRVFGALFIGMVITAILAFVSGQLHFQGVVSLPPVPELVAYNPVGAVGDVFRYNLLPALFSFLLVTTFDTTGTVLGLAEQAGLMEGNQLPRAGRALLADALASLVGAIFGTSPTSAYVESAAGIAAGGKTGLTALVVAIFFVVAAFFSPLIRAVSGVAAITGPALIIVGALMLSNIRHVQWDAFDEAFPAFIVILTMPLSSSIATGLAMGFIFYPLLKIFAGKWREVHPLVYIFGVLFLADLLIVGHI